MVQILVPAQIRANYISALSLLRIRMLRLKILLVSCINKHALPIKANYCGYMLGLYAQQDVLLFHK